MSYKMMMNKKKFLKTEFGAGLENVIRTWDMVLEQNREDSTAMKERTWCQAQWEVYQLAMKQFYGIEYHFTRTDEYFGICTGDGGDYLLKIERDVAITQKVTRRGVRNGGKSFWTDDLVHSFLGKKVNVTTSASNVFVKTMTGELVATFDKSEGE